MASLRRLDIPAGSSIWIAKEKKAPKGKGALTLGWLLFLGIGIPFGFMAALGPLAYAGIYIAPLAALWQPWPPDVLKPYIGVGIFIGTFAYLIYRMGQDSGFHWGNVTATAALRNLTESRALEPGPEQQVFAVASDSALPAPPMPPAPEQPPRIEATQLEDLRTL
jgi:hypothetical protein